MTPLSMKTPPFNKSISTVLDDLMIGLCGYFTENWDEWAGGETEEQNEEGYQEDYQGGYEPHADDPDFCVSPNILLDCIHYSTCVFT